MAKKKRLADRKLQEGGFPEIPGDGRKPELSKEPDVYNMTHKDFGKRLADGFNMMKGKD